MIERQVTNLDDLINFVQDNIEALAGDNAKADVYDILDALIELQ